MYATFNRFEIKMTLEQAKSVSHQGQCDEDVKFLSQEKAIARQFKKINPDDIRAELKEYGAWDEIELSDDAENIQRILWIAGCNIKEEDYEKKNRRNK